MIKTEFYQGSLEDLFKESVALIDVRAPIEFGAGALPNSINHPLLSDEQRHLIGICYKEKGQTAAIELGHQLVSGHDREKKISAWIKQIEANKKVYLYCARGGLRSQISQSWIQENGKEIQIIPGGFKALRNFLLDNIENETKENSFLIISGNTGSGKTDLLNKLSKDGQKTLDLEELANHRGSAFGGRSSPQPTQIDFENKLSIQFFREKNKKNGAVLVEDEGQRIGKRIVPLVLHHKLERSPIFVYERSLEERIALILRDYCILSWEQMSALPDAHEHFFSLFKGSFDKIQKKLGGVVYNECLHLLSRAITVQKEHGDFSVHQDWIKKVLVHYYDPTYAYGLNKRKELIIARGDEKVLREILNSQVNNEKR